MKEGGRLPEGLQEVEYLESTGEQWIDTGIKGSNGASSLYTNYIVVKFMLQSSEYQYPIGAYSGRYWYIEYYQRRLTFTFGSRPNFLIYYVENLWMDCVVDVDNAVVKVNNSEYQNLDFDQFENLSYDIYLFSANYNNSPFQSSKGRIALCKLLNGNTLLRDFIPCYTTVPNFINELGNQVPIGTKGMYDLVNNVLYTNRGTGADFIAGPDV